MRPTYPELLFGAVARRGGLSAGSRVLEIGPGTGQATLSMVDRGWAVEAVEIDPAMAAVAERRTGGRVRIRKDAFESVPLGPPVDLVLSATSFHWLDPQVRLKRIASALRPGGTLAVIWTRHVRGGTQAFFDAADACYRRYGGDDREVPLLDEAEVEPPTAELKASTLFADVTTERFTDETTMTTEHYLDLQRTYSTTIALSDDAREALLACLATLIDGDHGGRVVKRSVFDLVLATRV